MGLIDGGLKLRTMRLPDIFQDQDAPHKQYEEAGLNAHHIVETVAPWFGKRFANLHWAILTPERCVEWIPDGHGVASALPAQQVRLWNPHV